MVLPELHWKLGLGYPVDDRTHLMSTTLLSFRLDDSGLLQVRPTNFRVIFMEFQLSGLSSDRLRSPNFRSLINENILGKCFRSS